MAQPLRESSTFTWTEKIEHWPQLDPNFATFQLRETYPGSMYGTARGETGEVLGTGTAIKQVQVDRDLSMIAVACTERWAGKEVFDVIWESRKGPQTATLPGASVNLDISLDGSHIAVLAWNDGSAFLHRIDSSTRATSLIAEMDRSEISGGEQLRWSTDQRTALVVRAGTNTPTFLVDMFTGAQTPLPWSGESTWWYGRSPSSLLVSQGIPGGTQLFHGDLATGELTPLDPIAWPPGFPAHRGSRSIYNLEVSADGGQFVGEVFVGAETMTEQGRSGEGSFGGCPKWASGSLPMGTAPAAPVVDRWSPDWCWQGSPALELVQNNVRWCRRAR